MGLPSSVLRKLDAVFERRADFVIAAEKTQKLSRELEARGADSLEVTKTRQLQLEIETSL